MATTSVPVTFGLWIYTGASFRREFRWKPGGTDYQDFTGWAARMAIGQVTGPILTTLSTAAGTITLGSDGSIKLEMDDDHTSLLPPGTYSYALDLIDPSGFVMRFMRGRVEVIRDVQT